jgi:predicted GNAT family acetyltransferase
MYPLIRIVLFISLVLVSSGGTAPGQQASASPAKPTPSPTPIPLSKVALEAQSALASLQAINASVSKDQSSADSIARTLLDLTNEIDARIAGDTRLLTTSLSIDLRYWLKLTWQNFDDSLLVSARELTQHSTSLEEQLARLDQLTKTWQATLQLAKQPDTPPLVLQRVQSVVDSVERTRQAAEFVLAHVLTLQSRLSEEEARVRTVLSSIEQVEIGSFRILFVRDSPPCGDRSDDGVILPM